MQTNVNAQRDLETLTALNRDFVESVQTGDVKRLGEIFADDFMVSTPDGSLLDKTEYLKLVAQPVTISGLVAEDVRIRLLGDFAIIHARFNSRFADGRQRRLPSLPPREQIADRIFPHCESRCSAEFPQEPSRLQVGIRVEHARYGRRLGIRQASQLLQLTAKSPSIDADLWHCHGQPCSGSRLTSL